MIYIYICDSAGTIDFHKGKPADSRMKSHAKLKGIDIQSISRPFDINTDFEYFDKIFVMDSQNFEDINKLSKRDEYSDKIEFITNYCTKYTKYKHVPDPYYGGNEGFNLVLEILKDACQGLLDYLESK